MRPSLSLLLFLGALGCGGDPSVNMPGDGPVCATGRYYNHGDRGDNFMHPGVACVQCHSERRRGPVFSVAGTVFNARHEEDDCFGNAGNARTGQNLGRGRRSDQPHLRHRSQRLWELLHHPRIPLSAEGRTGGVTQMKVK